MIRSAVALFLILAPTLGFAHGGGLDANGCHTNRKTGDYHCHRAPTAPSPSGTVATPRVPAPMTSNVNPLYSQSQPAPTGKVLQGAATERELVLTVQLLLLALGYSPGEPGGVLTSATITAIKQFQADRSLTQDGLINGSLLVRLSEQIALKAKAS
jgi:Putative peptidoglycan binding domain